MLWCKYDSTANVSYPCIKQILTDKPGLYPVNFPRHVSIFCELSIKTYKDQPIKTNILANKRRCNIYIVIFSLIVWDFAQIIWGIIWKIGQDRNVRNLSISSHLMMFLSKN